jgi:hypothetical protein
MSQMSRRDFEKMSDALNRLGFAIQGQRLAHAMGQEFSNEPSERAFTALEQAWGVLRKNDPAKK